MIHPPTRPRLRLRAAAIVLLAATFFAASASQACVGTECLQLFSTADGGGALTISFDFAARKIQTYPALCASGQCLYSAIDPGFIIDDGVVPDGFFPIAAGTAVELEVVAIDPAITLRVDGTPLRQAGTRAALGEAPAVHVHPSWQLNLPEGVHGDYLLSIKLNTTSAAYSASQVFTLTLTNVAVPGTPTPTATPTPTTASAVCPGDCNSDGRVAVNEILRGVNDSLTGGTTCPALDRNGSGTITVNELILAVGTALDGCAAAPTPTATQPASFALIQSTIFSPRCAIPTCHDDGLESGDLNLEADEAYDALVGVEPEIDVVREAGLLRVDPGDPDNSFLLVKLLGPPLGQGGRMPLTGPALSAAEIQLITDWIAQGAPR
ncbi:MAG: hypothetical protein ACRERC_13860 [Candidatus Binatia bacterium]